MGKTLDLFRTSFVMLLATEMMYKFNFIVRFITLTSFDMVLPFVTLLIYLNTNGFPGWSLPEILLFQSIVIMISGIDRMFFWSVAWEVSDLVQNGTFDRLFLLPVSTIQYLIFTTMGVEHIPEVLVGIGMFIYSVAKLNIDLGLINLMEFLGYLSLAVLLMFSLLLIRLSIIIVNVKGNRVGELIRVVKSFSDYPVDVFGRVLAFGLTYVLPLAVVAYMPAAALLNKTRTNFFIIAAIVILMFVLSLAGWRSTLKRYSSAGG